jgi:hypothetical protein
VGVLVALLDVAVDVVVDFLDVIEVGAVVGTLV